MKQFYTAVILCYMYDGYSIKKLRIDFELKNFNITNKKLFTSIIIQYSFTSIFIYFNNEEFVNLYSESKKVIKSK